MAELTRGTRHTIFMILGLLTGGATVWLLMAFMLSPNEDDFRVRAAGHYAQQMSHYGVGHLASFRDCSLEDPDPFQRLRGINWIGECTTSARGTGYVYEVQLDGWARHKGENFRVLAP